MIEGTKLMDPHLASYILISLVGLMILIIILAVIAALFGGKK